MEARETYQEPVRLTCAAVTLMIIARLQRTSDHAFWATQFFWLYPYCLANLIFWLCTAPSLEPAII